MKDCYPIHPEIFERLFQDWSVIPGFQKTRGVLRIMATYISRLYREQDQSLLIMPANLPLEDPTLADEFTRLLTQSGGNWDPVVKEVDSHVPGPTKLTQNPQYLLMLVVPHAGSPVLCFL